jgi:hypothetical protein
VGDLLRSLVALQHDEPEDHAQRQPAGDAERDAGVEQDRGERDRRHQHEHDDREAKRVIFGAERVDHSVSLLGPAYRM